MSYLNPHPNETFAEFMGARVTLEFSHTPVAKFPNGKKCLLRGLKYKTKWDALMPVCQKLLSGPYLARETREAQNNLQGALMFPKLENVYKYALEFIVIINQLKNANP